VTPHEPETGPAEARTLAARYRRLQELRHQHPGREIAVFFAAGVLFDIVTLSRIDDLFNLLQQGVYIVVLAGLMAREERIKAGVAAPPRFLRKAWHYSQEAIHFLLGSLLSAFTLLFLKSTSGLASFFFLSFLATLLVVNELPRFQALGPIVRFGLLSLCLTTYLALLLPIVAGFLSAWLFLAAVGLACAGFYWLVRRLSAATRDAGSVWRRVAAPAFAVQGLLVVAYFAGVIPPVPLSVQFIGIYHEVVPPGARVAPAPSPDVPPPAQEAGMADGIVGSGFTGGASTATRPGYQLKHLRPWWKVWQHGDQDFEARPGDVVYCFARVFAPRGFKDAVYVHWWAERRSGGWDDQGRARLEISGGRGEGFRAFATKRNYHPGRWRVEIESEDGRDLGVIHFNLTSDESTEERTFAVDAG